MKWAWKQISKKDFRTGYLNSYTMVVYYYATLDSPENLVNIIRKSYIS